MKTHHGLHKMLFWILTGVFLLSGVALASDISGRVNYSGSKTGRIYIVAEGNGRYGTSIATAGTFTIRGLSIGNYTLGAFMDTVGDSNLHASNPAGLSSTVNVSGSLVTGVTITIADPAPVPPTAPTGMYAFSPGSGTAGISWDSQYVPYGPKNAVVPDRYNLYWSTDPNVMSNVTGSVKNIPANENNNLFFLNGLTNGLTYYYLMTGATGTIISSGSTTTSVTVAPPAGGYTVSGFVDYSGFNPANKKLYALIFGDNSIFYQKINLPAPTSPLAFTVSHVPNGTYWVWPVFDMNGDGLINTGDIGSERPVMITVSNAAVSDVTVAVSAANASATISTGHYKGENWEGYNLSFEVAPWTKQPVKVVMTGGPQVSGPVDVPIDSQWGGFNNWVDVQGAPLVGDTYSLDVTYSDASTETLTAQVTGVLNSFPTPLAPVGNIPYNGTPTFTWQAPSSPPSGEYTYGLWLNGNNNSIWWNAWDLPSTQLSAVYNAVGDASQPTLSNNMSYWWQVSVRDSQGNSAGQQVRFSMGAGISGKVTSDGTTGIPGIWVTVYSNSYSWVGNSMTNADGAYSIGGLAPGDYKVNFSANNTNYMSEWYDNASDFESATFVTVVPDQATQVNAVLAPAGSISGRVTNGTVGIQNVSVGVCKQNSGTGNCDWGFNGANTDANGYYTLGGLPSGQYKVQFNGGNAGYIGEWYNNKSDMALADIVTVTVGATTPLADAVLVQGGGISGRVTNGATGIWNVWIQVCKFDSGTGNCDWGFNGANTDQSGYYTLGGLPAGQYKVQFDGSWSGSASEWYNDKTDMASANTVTVTVGATTPLDDAVLVLGGSISGRVTNGSTGIQNVLIQACKYDSGSGNCIWGVTGANTDPSGDYTLGGLSAGQYKVNFFGGNAGYISEWYNDKADMVSANTVTVTAGVPTPLDDAVLALGASITGRVTNGATGIQNVWVQVCKYDSGSGNCDWGNGTNTDINGMYTLGGLPAGQYKIHIDSTGTGYVGEWYNNKADMASADPVTVTVGSTPLADAVLVQETINYSVNPASLSYGGQLVGTMSVVQGATVRNTGTGPLVITSIVKGGAYPSQFVLSTTCPIGMGLPVGGTCKVKAKFKPTSIGMKNAELIINVMGPVGPKTVALSGTGLAPIAKVTPTTLSYPNQVINTVSIAQTVTVRNTGTAPLFINGISKGGVNQGQFSYTTLCPIGGAGLGVGASCTIKVKFKPTTAGVKNASLSVNVAAPALSRTVDLSGIAVVSAGP